MNRLLHSTDKKNYGLTELNSKTVYLNTFFALIFLTIMWSCKENVTEPPQVRPDLFNITFITPEDSTYINAPVALSVEVESENPVKDVIFYIDNRQVGVVNERPYTVSPDLSQWADNEYHHIKCVAEDVKNNAGVREINCRISDQVLNYINLTEPANNDTVRYGDRAVLKWIYNGKQLFEVQVAEDASFSSIIQYETTGEFNLTTIQLEQKRYYWRVGYYRNDSLPLSWSNSRFFTIDGPKPPSFISLESESIIKYQSEYTFRWNKSEFANQYQLQVSDPNTGNIIFDDLINDTLITKSLDMNVYKIRGRSKNGSGLWGNWSDEIVLSNGLYLKKITAGSDISITGCIQLPDSGFILAGYSYNSRLSVLIKVDALGNEVNSNMRNGFMLYKLSLTKDNNIIMIGRDNSSYTKVIKADQNFNIIWEYEPPENDKIRLHNVTVAENGDYLVVGDYNPNPAASVYKVYFSRLSSTGSVLLAKVVGDSVSIGYNIEEKNGNYLVMARHVDSMYISTSAYNLIVDQSGNVLSEYHFLVWPGSPYQGYTVVGGISVDNDVYCYGYAGMGQGAFLHKSDIFGNEFWRTDIPFVGSISAQKCLFTSDGNLMVGGQEVAPFLCKISPAGNIIWKIIYNITSNSCIDLINTFDGGIFAIFNYYQSQGTYYIVKMSTDGVTYSLSKK